MLPQWVTNNFTIKWFRNGNWEDVVLSQTDDGEFAGVTPDQAKITISVRHDKKAVYSDSMDTYALEATITGNQDGFISGVQLLMPLEQSLHCVWKPLLSPLEGMAVGDKMFRSPAIILENERSMTALIPDIELIKSSRLIPHIMDYSMEDHVLMYGLSDYTETGHVYHQLTPHPYAAEDRFTFRVYLVEWKKQENTIRRDFRKVEQFLWEMFGKQSMAGEEGQSLPQPIDLKPYVKHAYEWALERWKDVCWQEFNLNGREVGGVAFIVTARQKPGYGQEQVWREPKSLWNQAWFCSLRTAYGYWWWGKHEGRHEWVEKAEKALEFALSSPMVGGLFPGYYEAGEDNSWETGGWVMSGPRRPEGHEGFVHLLDSSWTCYWLLQWYRDLQQDVRILDYVGSYVERLLSLQNADGSYPAWVNPNSFERSPFLIDGPETSIHAMLLCLYHDLNPDPRYIAAAERAATFVVEQVVPVGRWEDFETYWSCSKQWDEKQYGCLDKRSGLYNQCNFGMYWTAEALKSLYRKTGAAGWLEAGEIVLAEISLYQQIWQPPFLPVPTVGGFGVMNSDDEWNDARQSLFAITYLDYYQVTGNKNYLARALWAMKASFYMMYCPENPQVKKLYESVHSFFNEYDYGFHMENFNHHDGTAVNGLGEFTIFDWGCGAASTSLAQFLMNSNK